MYKWIFYGCAICGERFSFTIKASNKPSAIEKGTAKVRQKFGHSTSNWKCELLNY